MSESSRAPPKKEQDSLLLRSRTDLEENLAQRLSLALSTKISEKVGLLATPSGPDEEGEELYSPSSNSTVSSSGAIEGVYMLNESDLAESDVSTGDEDSGGCGQQLSVIYFVCVKRRHNLCLECPVSKLKPALDSSNTDLSDDVLRSIIASWLKFPRFWEKTMGRMGG